MSVWEAASTRRGNEPLYSKGKLQLAVVGQAHRRKPVPRPNATGTFAERGSGEVYSRSASRKKKELVTWVPMRLHETLASVLLKLNTHAIKNLGEKEHSITYI